MSDHDFLERFYAVTKSRSLYRAEIYGQSKVPLLRKIAKQGESKVSIGEEMNDGTMLSIGRQLQLFIPEGGGKVSQVVRFEREIAAVNTVFWGANTSDVVALFTVEEEALSCLRENDLAFCDPRWEPQTIAVLRLVGKEHPYCSVATYPSFWLMPPEKWQ